MPNSNQARSRRPNVVFCLSILMFLLVRSASAQTPVPPSLTPVAGPAPQSVNLVKQITPSGALQAGQEVQVHIRLSGDSLPQCYGTPRQPIDAVVLLDTSPSAGKPIPGSNLFRAKQILHSLWAQMDQPVYAQFDDKAPQRSRLAIVTVDTGVTAPEIAVRLPLTDTTEVISHTIAAIDNGADSEFATGINRSLELLRDTARPAAQKVLILLFHDNFFALQPGVQEAIRQAPADTMVFIIINWLNVPSAPNDERLQEADAVKLTSAERVVRDPSADDLRRLFVRAAGSDASVVARGFRVYDEISPAGLVDIIGIENGGRVENGRVVWDVSEVSSSQAVDLNYRFRVRTGVSSPLEVRTGAACLDCNGFLHTYLDQNGQPVTTPVVEETIVVGDAPTATLTPTSTPTPAAGGATTITRTPGPIGPISTPSFGFDWRWLLLLLIPLIGLLLWWLRRHLERKRKRREEDRRRREEEGRRREEERRRIEEERRRREQGGNGEEVRLPTPPGPTGDDIQEGGAVDDSALMARLRAAPVIAGRVPTGQRGFTRSSVRVQVFNTAKEMREKGGLNLSALGTPGSQFHWNEPGAQPPETTVAVDKLQGIIEERIAPKTPLLAVWTSEAADNATFEVKLQPNPAMKRVDAQVRSLYRSPQAGEPAPEKSYWIELRFLNNSAGNPIVAVPSVEVEAGTNK